MCVPSPLEGEGARRAGEGVEWATCKTPVKKIVKKILEYWPVAL